MQRVLTNSQMRFADEYTINRLNVPSQELMHRAGEAIAKTVKEVLKDISADSIKVVCGTGNNGGDGYVCAEILRADGVNVAVYAFDGNFSADCGKVKSLYKGKYTDNLNADIIVDCIFGTGLDREITEKYSQVIDEINLCKSFVISADIPSGINGDNGLICGGAVKADITVAIGEYKTGHFLNDGLDYCGKVIKCDIGIVCPETGYAEIAQDDDMEEFFPKRKRNSNKGSYGVANIVAGSDKYIGAVKLSAEGALRSGCGYVKITTSDSAKLALLPSIPQAIFLDEIDKTANAIAIGMGCGVSQTLYDDIKKLLKNYGGTMLIDADGINALAKYGKEALLDKNCKVILTPHIKEFSRLTGYTAQEIVSDSVNLAKNFAKEYDVIINLKSAASIITDGERVAINIKGSSALAKGGSGDILSGFTCGTLARGVAPFEACLCSAYALGLSAEITSEDKGDYCATANDILKNLHIAVKRLTK